MNVGSHLEYLKAMLGATELLLEATIEDNKYKKESDKPYFLGFDDLEVKRLEKSISYHKNEIIRFEKLLKENGGN